MGKINCPEFTSLCPITGQPDFAEIVIRYIPAEKMVESKSLKLYLFSFRDHGDFHEDCVNIIMKDLKNLMEPKYFRKNYTFVAGIMQTTATYRKPDCQLSSTVHHLQGTIVPKCQIADHNISRNGTVST